MPLNSSWVQRQDGAEPRFHHHLAGWHRQSGSQPAHVAPRSARVVGIEDEYNNMLLWVCLLCFLCDLILMTIGVLGVGTLTAQQKLRFLAGATLSSLV